MKISVDQYEVTECGHTSDGLRVQAITDAMGAQVVVTNDSKQNDDSLLSQPLENHRTAIALGKTVANYGIAAYKNWCKPIDTMAEFCVIVATQI